MVKKRILFICKHNMFRSKVGEAYFKKLSNSKNLKISSAGPIKGNFPLNKKEVNAAKKLGIALRGKPKGLSIELLKKQDIIVNIADDVPKNFFNNKDYMNPKTKVLNWKINDVTSKSSEKQIQYIMKKIMKKVEDLNKKLENKK